MLKEVKVVKKGAERYGLHNFERRTHVWQIWDPSKNCQIIKQCSLQ